MLTRRTFFALVFFLLIKAVQSQNAELTLDSFPARLTQCFHHDSYGFMWMGTQDGLLRYDGIDFKHYRHLPFDSNSISNNWVSDIQEDSHGNLWISTYGGGLNYFDQLTQNFKHFAGSKEKNANNYIIKIFLNDDGSLWFTGMTHTLTHFELTVSGQPQYKHYDLTDEPESKSFPSANSAFNLKESALPTQPTTL